MEMADVSTVGDRYPDYSITCCETVIKKESWRLLFFAIKLVQETSQVVLWLRLHASTAGVQSLVRELRSCILHSMAKTFFN